MSVKDGMPSRFSHDDDQFREASADQREMVRLVRATRTEFSKRLSDIGCLNPDEIKDMLGALDQLIDLHVYAHTLDDRLECTRERLQRIAWND